MTLFHWLTRCLCLHAHTILKRDAGRLCVHCLHCGHESQGWVLDEAPPVRRF
jgi:hypothetical protein